MAKHCTLFTLWPMAWIFWTLLDLWFYQYINILLLRLAIAFKGLTDVDGIEWVNDTDNLVTLQYYAGKPVFLVFMSVHITFLPWRVWLWPVMVACHIHWDILMRCLSSVPDMNPRNKDVLPPSKKGLPGVCQVNWQQLAAGNPECRMALGIIDDLQ